MTDRPVVSGVVSKAFGVTFSPADDPGSTCIAIDGWRGACCIVPYSLEYLTHAFTDQTRFDQDASDCIRMAICNLLAERASSEGR